MNDRIIEILLSRAANLLSLGLVFAALLAIIFTPLNKGIEFDGGYAVKHSLKNYEPSPSLEKEISHRELSNGVETLKIKSSADKNDLDAMKKELGSNLLSIEAISPSYGEELIKGVMYAAAISFAVVATLTTLRHNIVMASAVIVALLHDIIVSLGVAVYLGVEINTLLLAGIVMIIGYSINDSIVTIWQISENVRAEKASPVATAIQSVLPRSLITSISTILVVLVLMLSLSNDTGVSGFILILAVGVITGTFSSLVVVPAVINLSRTSLDVTPTKSLDGNV